MKVIILDDETGNLNEVDISSTLDNKADKVSGATPGNLASLDATGNLQDSGKSVSSFTGIIRSNLTLNVPSEYATIHDALNYLKDKFIPSDVTVTIQVASGTHNYSSQVTIQHPCGSQIQIIGADPVTTTLTGVGTISGSAGNWSVPLQVADAAGIAVGDYVIVRDTTGTDDHYALRGVWEVTNVLGTTVTVKNTHRKSTFPSFSVTGGTVVCLKTILKFAGCSGIVAYDSVLGYLNNVAIVGDGTANTHGIVAGRETIGGSQEGTGAVICGENVGASNFYYGIMVRGGRIRAEYVASCNNIGGGIASYLGGVVYANYAVANGNNNVGFYADFNGAIYTRYSTASGNANDGFVSAGVSYLDTRYSTASGNGLDYHALRMGFIRCGGYDGSPTFSPALNTEGNYNSIITT